MSSPPGDPSEDNSNGGSYPYNGKILLAAVIVLSVVIFLVLLLHAYARWLLKRRPAAIAHVVGDPLRHRRSLTRFSGQGTEVRLYSKGLEAKAIAALPTFVYRTGVQEGAPDCVVCLSAMEDGETGRILPSCGHEFHAGCIDVWLMSHSTCPICRNPVSLDESSLKEEDGGPTVAVTVAAEEMAVREEVRRSVDGELVSTEAGPEAAVAVEVPGGSIAGRQTMKDDEASSSSSSSPPSMGCSLMRMLSTSRSENKVFPSACSC